VSKSLRGKIAVAHESSFDRMKIGVIGAGPAGLTAALSLAKLGHEVEVFEAGPFVGGLARSIDLWGQRVDLGPHRFFSRDPRVTAFWREVVGSDQREVRRRTRILHIGRLYDYPLRPLNALRTMGTLRAAACGLSYTAQVLRNRLRPSPQASFEQWVVSRFGRVLFDMFFRAYSEKLWGIDCSELDADFASQRIKQFSLGAALASVVKLDRRRHATVLDQFAYPTGGTGMVYERIATRLAEHGGQLHLSHPVAGINEKETGLRFPDGTCRRYDHLISTMPLTRMVASLEDVPDPVVQAAASLRYRNTLLVYLLLDQPDLFPDQWIYVQSPELRVGRITNFRNWVPELHGSSTQTILTLEYWCDAEDAQWTEADASLIATATRELQTTGLAANARVLDGHVLRLPRCYPVYRRGYKEHLQPVIEHLRGLAKITAIGRYGSFKYNNQDHSILMGLLAAESIALGKEHDLWSVNTDYDAYQEEPSVSNTTASTSFTESDPG